MNCLECKTENQLFASYCRKCGALLPYPEASWPQDGGTPRRFTTGQFKENDIFVRQWGHQQQCSLSPVVTGNRVVILVTKTEQDARHNRCCFIAYALSTGEKIWECDAGQSNLTTLSSPVCFGAFVYFVTADPNHLHRIHLASGMRELIALDLNGELRDTIPGRMFPHAAPLLLGTCPSAQVAARHCARQPCLLLTDQGLIFLHLEASACGDLPTVKTYQARCALPGNGWTSPALMGKTILATDRENRQVIYANLEAYPAHIPVRIEKPKLDEATSFREFSPCIAFEAIGWRNMYVWTARDTQDGLYIVYRLEDGRYGMKAMNISAQHGILGMPVTNGKHVFLTGLNQHYPMIAQWNGLNMKPSAKPLEHVLQGNALLPVDEAGQYFFAVKDDCPVSFSPHPAVIQFNNHPAYFDREHATPAGRPVAGPAHVLVTTSKGLVCYKSM